MSAGRTRGTDIHTHALAVETSIVDGAFGFVVASAIVVGSVSTANKSDTSVICARVVIVASQGGEASSASPVEASVTNCAWVSIAAAATIIVGPEALAVAWVAQIVGACVAIAAGLGSTCASAIGASVVESARIVVVTSIGIAVIGAAKV